MRFFKTYSKDEVSAPKNEIVAIDSKFVQKESVTLVLKEKLFSMSMDDFSIKDTNGVAYFKCEGKAFSVRPKKIVYDTDKNPLFNIQHKLLAFKPTAKIYTGTDDSNQIAKISLKKVISVKKYIVEFHNKATGKDECIEMKCDTMGYSCGIFYGKEKEGAPMIGKVFQKLDAKTALTGAQNYFLQVAPGVDLSFLVAIALCFDEFKNEQRENERK